ncbi:MAG: hypothetical protein QGG50_04970 [Methanopyri archaeon]|nr:hypothetical protein [Methanopyri archaeon]
MSVENDTSADVPCAVLYSGGSDSTLAAVLMSRRFRPVHLLTYDRQTVRKGVLTFPGLRDISKSSINAKQLEEAFGKGRFIHHMSDYTSLFRRIAVDDVDADRRRFGSRLFLLICMGCKLGMHAQAIADCLELGVRRVADGASQEEAFYPAQTRGVMDRLRGLYKEHGITYENPVYSLPNKNAVHDALEDAGIRMVRPAEGALSPRRYREALLSFPTQAWCWFGLQAAMYNKFFYGPLFDKDREPDALAYIDAKMDVVRSYLEERGVKD